MAPHTLEIENLSKKITMNYESLIKMVTTVPVKNLRHFTLKASGTSVHAEPNAHSADWLMNVFVNELAPPHVRIQQGQCVQQCRRILAYTVS